MTGLTGLLPGIPMPEPEPEQAPVPELEQLPRRFEFFVPGEPKPMGSKSAFIVGGRAIVTDGKAGKGIKGWKDSVIAKASEVFEGKRMTGPVRVAMTFALARPAGHRGTKGLRPSAPAYPAVKPDLDKLARSTLDALAVVMLADDSRVVMLSLVKLYAKDGPTGAHIRVEEMA